MLGDFIDETKQESHLKTLNGIGSFILLSSLPHLEVKKPIGAIHSVDTEIQIRVVRVILKYQLGGMLVGNQSDYLIAQLG